MNERLKKARQALGLSQAAVAASIGYSQGYYAGIESGARQLPPRIATAICEKFGISREWLETGGGDIFSPPAPKTPDELLAEVREQLDLPPLAYDVLRAYVALNDEQKSKVKEVIALLSGNKPIPDKVTELLTRQTASDQAFREFQRQHRPPY